MAISTHNSARALRRRPRPDAAAGFIPSRRAPRATISAAIATASSIPPPSGASATRRRSSSITRATITAPGSPIRWRSCRSRARWRARSGSTRTWPRRRRSRTISAIRPSGMPASARSTRCLEDYGGFDHNAQALRIVTALERRYAQFDGLNLTWETLEGLVKHNGPLTDRQGRGVGRYAQAGVPAAILAYSALQDLELWSFASAEAQAAAHRRRHRLRRARHRRRPARRPVFARRHRRGAADRRHRARDRRAMLPGSMRPAARMNACAA